MITTRLTNVLAACAVVALFLGAVLKYDIAELVDPHLNVVAKVPKSALVSFKKP